MCAGIKFALAEDFIERFCLFLEKNGRSPVTVMAYRCDLEGLVRWAESRNQEAFDIRHFVANDLERYREFLIRKFQPKTTNRKLATLKVFLSWARRPLGLDELPHVPNVKLAPKERSQPSYLSLEQQDRLLQAVAERGTAMQVAAISLMLNTGIRVSELCALTWGDIIISDHKSTVTLYSSKQKRHVEVPLNKRAREALIALGQSREPRTSEAVFTGPSGPITRTGVARMLDRYSKLAKLKNWSPVVLRHTFCMNLIHANVSPEIIAKLMGHRSAEMTLAYYAVQKPDLMTSEERHAVERLT
jgi:site-specific recombinase XerD